MSRSYSQTDLMDTVGLARKARALREERRLTLDEVASQIINEKTGKPISRQAVWRAENETVGSEMNGVRVRIIETLTGHKLEGPVWHFK